MEADMDVDYSSPLSSEVLQKWRSYVAPYPLPPHLTPEGGAPLSTVSDEALLSTPPSLIAHAQRTASQGGLQVISPRQIPFSSLLNRRVSETRRLGEHEVGSIADPNAEWPTIDGADFSLLLPDQPLAPLTEEVTMRPKTRTTSLTKGADALSDPVLSCLIKGRAVVDILKRDDVAGDAEQMAALLASAWGIEENELMELDGYSLGVEGELQRHAMKVDEVYPTLYAPTHVRSVISMGVSDMDKSVLLPGMAMDWRRMRVFCEAIFYLTCTVEGLPIKYMRSLGVPGQRSGSRENMLVFIPGAATAWCAAAETFSLSPNAGLLPKKRPDIPVNVRDALQLYVRRVRPVSAILAGGKRPNTWVSTATAVEAPMNETLSSSYAVTTRSMATGPFRGKVSSAAVRNAIYQVMESAPIQMRTRMARYLSLAPEECRAHLGTDVVPDVVVSDLASRFTELGRYMRERIAKESERRGASLESWWEDLVAQAPAAYSLMKESPEAWCSAAVWLAFREPTDRWRKLKAAVKFRALSAAVQDSIGLVPLPAEKGSIERLEVAARTTVKSISKAFAGFYLGVSDVGYAVGKAAEDMGKTRTALHMKEGAHLWTLRARSLRALNVCTIAYDEQLKSKNHLRVAASPADLVLKPAPYMPYKAWKRHILDSPDIPVSSKKMVEEADKILDKDVHRRSAAFARMDRPILVCKKSTVTRYLSDPKMLATELEEGWEDLKSDVTKLANMLAEEAAPPRVEKRRAEEVVESVDLMRQVVESEEKKRKVDAPVGLKGFWDIYATMSEDVAEGIDEELGNLPEDVSAMFYEGEFRDIGHINQDIARYKAELDVSSNPTGETVR